MNLPYGRQVIDDDDVAEVVRALKGDYLTTGPEVPAFEAAFASYVGAPHAVACANGTAALHLICMALGLSPGDQVIVPSVTFVATANAPRYCGAEVIFADVDPDSGQATAETISSAIRRADPTRLKAIFVVHLGGGAADLESISVLAAASGVPLVEDACHAIGSEHPGRNGTQARVGDCSFSSMCSFSFHPVKTFTTGEGGAVTTRDPLVARRLQQLRNHGLERDPTRWVDPDLGCDPKSGGPNPWVYELQVLGYNYRLTDVMAALGQSQLRKMAQFAERRRSLARCYRRLFETLPETARLATCCLDPQAVLHLMIALFDFEAIGTTRQAVVAALKARGIGTQVHYIPVHRQPYYRGLAPGLILSGADRYYERCLTLPLFVGMDDRDVDRVVDALREILG